MTLGLVLGLGVLQPELRGVLLVLGLLLLALLTISLSQTVLHILGSGGDVLTAECAVLDLFLILLLDTTDLVDGDSALHELGDDLLT